MKKNPFTAVGVHGALIRSGDSFLLLRYTGGGAYVRLPNEQAEYAAEAINQHREMHYWLKALEFGAATISGIAVCPACRQRRDEGHKDKCSYDALLKEEEVKP